MYPTIIFHVSFEGKLNSLIVGSSAPHVGRAVDEEGAMWRQDMSELSSDYMWCPEALAPEVPWQKCWHDVAEEYT